jgi:hypothetical protein
MSDTATLVRALRVLARDIHCDDGIATQCITEAADEIERLRLTDEEREDIKVWLAECLRQCSTATEGGESDLAERWQGRARRAAAMIERLGDRGTRDAAEPSGASDGSHSNAVLWALEWREDAGRLNPEWVYDNLQWANEVNATGCYGRATVVPLYRSPTLTDAEREAIEKAIGRELDAEWYGGPEPGRVVALRGLLERTK